MCFKQVEKNMPDNMQQVRIQTISDEDAAKYPTYEVKTLNDMLNIPSDKIDDFLIDLGHMLKQTRQVVELSWILDPTLKVEEIVDLQLFTWVDDGKHELNLQDVQIDGQSIDFDEIKKAAEEQFREITDMFEKNKNEF